MLSGAGRMTGRLFFRRRFGEEGRDKGVKARGERRVPAADDLEGTDQLYPKRVGRRTTLQVAMRFAW